MNRLDFIRALNEGRHTLSELVWNTQEICDDPQVFVRAIDYFLTNTSPLGLLDIPKDEKLRIDLQNLTLADDGSYELFWVPSVGVWVPDDSKSECRQKRRQHIGRLRKLGDLHTYNRDNDCYSVDFHRFDDFWICELDDDIREYARTHA